jgi:hypothetical protein
VAQRDAGDYILIMRPRGPDGSGMELDLLGLRGRPSSSIALAFYDAQQQRLRLKFRPTGTYDYFKVPSRIVAEAIAANSLGRFVNWHIKPHYRYRRVH